MKTRIKVALISAAAIIIVALIGLFGNKNSSIDNGISITNQNQNNNNNNNNQNQINNNITITLPKDTVAKGPEKEDKTQDKVIIAPVRNNNIAELKQLQEEGKKLLDNVEKQSFMTWRNKCKGALMGSLPDIDNRLDTFEKERATHDYYSQATDIIGLLESEIQKIK